MNIIDAAFGRSRTVLLALAALLLAGAGAYQAIPKEAEPDVAIPNIYVWVGHEGISPGDAERLLVRPLEKALQSLEGLKELRASAHEGSASIMLEFDAGFDAERALRQVRERIDDARAELPAESEEPVVQEINVALFPVLTAVLAGNVPEPTLIGIARELKERIEALPGVLEVDIAGVREEVVDVIVDPTAMETYAISYDDVVGFVQRNNRLVAAGALDTGAGRLALKVPGVIEDLDDVLGLPVKVDGERVITVADIAQVQHGYKDPDGFARVDGRRALALEVSKRVGANIIETIAEVRRLIDAAQPTWPAGVEVRYLQDKSERIRTMLGDLQNNVLSAVLLVMIVVVAALGLRPAVLVGIAIPGSFLTGILVVDMMGYTLNIVSLFSLILVVGMLVDGAIVVVELADRNMRAGESPPRAYANAAARMAWPIIASTATTLAVFFPLLFWPGVVGEFMKYLPIMVIVCLTASLAMALIFVPVLGGVLTRGAAPAPGSNDAADTGRMTRAYRSLLQRLLRRPGTVLAAAVLVLAATCAAYSMFGRGFEFFPGVEPERAQLHVRARGDLSVWEKDAIVRDVEHRLTGMPELASVYARTLNRAGNGMGEDVIGVVQLELEHWQQRRPAAEILVEVRRRVADLAGVIVEARTEDSGPGAGKPVQIEVSAGDSAVLETAVVRLRDLMDRLGGFVDVEDTRPLPGIEWRLDVDRREAARFGADIALLGNAVKLLTNGIKLADYRPDSSNEEVDIRLRFGAGERHLGQLDRLRVVTRAGAVPIANFVAVSPAQKTGVIHRSGGQRVLTVKADVEEGALVAERLQALREAMAGAALPPAAAVTFKGEDADQRDASAFLTRAFVTAVLLMAIFLVTQFNSIYQAVLVLSAIVFSTAGVLLGLLVTFQPFGIVMCGIGVIALAGIVVNNNIILIDTFNQLRRDGREALSAALETGARRLRPVVLTASTTILGLLPMVLALNLDFAGRSVSVGAPSTQWWTQLSSAIAGGLAFATLLTLLLTPCLLVLGENLLDAWRSGRRRLCRAPLEAEQPSR